MAVAVAVHVPAASAAEPVAFAVTLEGEPEVGCIVITDGAPCPRNRVRAAVLPDGEPGFVGSLDFALPGLRKDGPHVLERGGRATLRGLFTPSADAAPLRCTFEGRMRVEGVLLPTSASTRRFHTGTFEAHGRCEGRRTRLRAIWSGSIGDTSGGTVFDFERFRGRLAGTMRLAGAAGLERHELPAR